MTASIVDWIARMLRGSQLETSYDSAQMVIENNRNQENHMKIAILLL